MQFSEVVRARHSIRHFTSDPVDLGVIAEIIEEAALAPSAMNSQPWRFHVATGETRDKVVEVMSQTTVYLEEYLEVIGQERFEEATRFYSQLGNAPVVVAVAMPRTSDELSRLHACLGVGAAIENFLLSATDKGLGSCSITFSFWVRDDLARTFEVPEDSTIVSLLLVGHPAVEATPSERRDDISVYLD